MKKIFILISTFTGLVALPTARAQEGVQPLQPRLISAFPNVRDLAVAPTLTEMYFTVQGYQEGMSAIVCTRLGKDKWEQPELAPFSGLYQDMEPFFAPGGLRLYFASNRPLSSQDSLPKDFDIWYVERSDLRSPWSAPMNLGKPVNTSGDEFYPSIAANKNLYITSTGQGSRGKDDIFFCKWNNGLYEPPVSLSDSINSPGYEFNAFIAPDESFLVYTCYSRNDGLGSGDLYISRKKPDGAWTEARNLGPGINSPQMDYCPWVDISNRRIYFTSKRNEVKPMARRAANLKEWMKELNKYANGLSRLYWAHWDFNRQ